MQHKIVYIVLVLIGFGTFGCKAKKQVAGTTPVAKPVNELMAEDALKKSQSEWTYYTSKADASVDGAGISQTADATIKMQKDSIIWISVGLFGFEGARIFMLPDSITILNKLNKSYSRMGWDEIGNYVGTDLNLRKTQNLLVANLLLPSDSNYKLNRDSSLYFIERIMESSLYKIRLDSISHHILYSFFRGEKTGKHLTIWYNDYEKVGVGRFPKIINMSAKDGLKKFDAHLKISNINTDAFGTLPTTVPSSFKRL